MNLNGINDWKIVNSISCNVQVNLTKCITLYRLGKRFISLPSFTKYLFKFSLYSERVPGESSECVQVNTVLWHMLSVYKSTGLWFKLPCIQLQLTSKCCQMHQTCSRWGSGGRLEATNITLWVAVWISLTEPSLDSKWLCDSLPAHCQDFPVLASLRQGY